MRAKIAYRLLRMGAQTLLGLRRQGYFIPYRYADRVPKARAEFCYDGVAKKMRLAAPNFLKAVDRAATHMEKFQSWHSESAPTDETPHFRQDWFPRLDGAMAYSMVAHYKPSRIIEVGCGHSTRFMRRALRDFRIDCEFSAIDPRPRTAINSENINYYSDYVQNIPLSLFASLRGGDILFIDSGHIFLGGSDVDFLLNGVLPQLPSGVLVHIHDIFLPYDYPKSWHWRGYNEQSAVALLLSDMRWRILWSSVYALRHCDSALRSSGLLDLPCADGAYESSLWLERLPAPPIDADKKE